MNAHYKTRIAVSSIIRTLLWTSRHALVPTALVDGEVRHVMNAFWIVVRTMEPLIKPVASAINVLSPGLVTTVSSACANKANVITMAS